MNASGIALIALALVAVLLVVVLAVVSRRRKRTTDLRGTFGSEYERTLDR